MNKKIIAAIFACVQCLIMTGCKSSDYKQAVELYDNGEYSESKKIFSQMNDYKESAIYLDHISALEVYDDVMKTREISLAQIKEKFSSYDTSFDSNINGLVSEVKELENLLGEYKYQGSTNDYTFEMDIFMKDGVFYAQPNTDIYSGDINIGEIKAVEGDYGYQINTTGEHYLMAFIEDLPPVGPFSTTFEIKANENNVSVRWTTDEHGLSESDEPYIFTR